MKKNKGLSCLFSILLLFSVSSCDLFDLDINTDPNNPSEASLELLLTNVELNLSSTFAGGLNNMAHGFVAVTTSTDDYSMNNQSWNGTWNGLYAGALNDLERLVVAAEEQGSSPHYLGVGRVLKAYYFSVMVDLWGDIPYSQAFKGDQAIKDPAYDDDAAIYTDLINLLDLAVANFAESQPTPVRGDVIYGSGTSTNITRWRKAAKTLKLRLLLQMRRASGAAVAADIQTLLTENDLILSAAEDFQFKFGRLQNPDNRHPWYQNGYAGGEAGFSYFGHQFMMEMLKNRDPRTPFYFKRQTTDILDPNDPTDKQTIPCSQRPDCIYGYFVLSNNVTQQVFGKAPDELTEDEATYLAGFFGRDRSDPSGIPNDNPLRTTVGAYPAAGLFDDVAESGGGNKGAGDGIFPMITSWMTRFYIIESMVSLGATYGKTESTLLSEALTAQFAKVFSVGTAADAAATSDVSDWGSEYDWPITYKTQSTFVSEVVAAYPAAGTESQKLNYVMKQAWFANFGNGFEMYNAFRRTGFPNDLQEPLQLPRQFALRLPYAQDELNLNPNTPTIVYDSPTDALFWDALKFQF